MCSEGKRVELGEALECLSAAFREWDEGPARGTVLEHEARRQEVWRSARLVTAAWRKGEGKRVEVAERLGRAVDELRTVARKSQPEDYPGNWRLRVGELLAAWDEAVAEGGPVQGEAAFEGMIVSSGTSYLDATLYDTGRFIEQFRSVKWSEQEPEVVSDFMFNAMGRVIGLLGDLKRAVGRSEDEGRPALVGEDAEAPVCGGPTDKFDVAPPDAPCPVPPKPEPECCTEKPKVCPLYPDCPEDCVAVFGTRCSLTDQLQRLWRGTSGNRTIIDAMSCKLDRLDKGLADLKQRFEEHIAL